MFEIKLIPHKDILESELNEVISLKSKQWGFGINEQKQWIEKNLNNNDLHLILKENDLGVAYLNLIDINLYLNDKQIKGFGVGNVCAIERGKGYGFKIMKEANKIISDLDRIGLLFCKEPLVKYYKSLDWLELNDGKFEINLKNTHCLFFNIQNYRDLKLSYDGLIF
ncbi:hypothetical protein B9T33_09775 [Acinetobacter sp. ANC 5054]|uniref:hypothetical protein n=1 Tax=Acinetobacter sp. ANC 5054 TaxID=1977877 RepID=UPI000A3571F2|nr:hypothetical protein [Acinetobacter sp. ANC 5054]OTG80196.1 hypothetical protein B9T33_09775 [Acinetobacter sp. ANC 5054]